MTAAPVTAISTYTSPGEVRAVALDQSGTPVRLFQQRWTGVDEAARFGLITEARLRNFADTLHGAFCELTSGEEVFIRLKSREGVTEGQALSVKVVSEAHGDKLARVVRAEAINNTVDAFQRWRTDLGIPDHLVSVEDKDAVSAAFNDAVRPTVTLAGGGQIHIEATRAITAIDIDTSGRVDKGSAGSRALKLNREAVTETVRQIALRGLGGLFVLDCVSPLNAEASGKLRETGQQAFEHFGLNGAKVLKPSPLGLMEMSLPWRYRPIHELLLADPAETQLLDLLRDVQREAQAAPAKFFSLSLCSGVWQAYLSRKTVVDQAVQVEFSGRVNLVESDNGRSEVLYS